MKKLFALLLATLLIVASACALAEGVEFSVNGSGIVRLQPDTVTVTASATAFAATVGEAQSAISASTTLATDALVALGIDPTDIVTNNYSFYPNYNYDQSPAVMNGYNAYHCISITLHDIALLDSVVTALTNSGFSSMDGVAFGVMDQTAAYRQALILAVQDAQAKAEALAEALGVESVSVKSVTENEVYNYNIAKRATMEAAAGDGSTGIRNGSVDVSANVRVTFEGNP